MKRPQAEIDRYWNDFCYGQLRFGTYGGFIYAITRQKTRDARKLKRKMKHAHKR